MFIVSLDTIKLAAPVGLYEQEALTLNELEIQVALAVPNADIHALPYIDYTLIYDKVKHHCSVRTPLLEDLLQHLYQDIKQLYPSALVQIEIAKTNPPISGNVKAAKVAWKEF